MCSLLSGGLIVDSFGWIVAVLVANQDDGPLVKDFFRLENCTSFGFIIPLLQQIRMTVLGFRSNVLRG